MRKLPYTSVTSRVRICSALAAVMACAMVLSAPAAADTLEFTTGAKLEGQVVHRSDSSVTFTTKVGERVYTREYSLDRIKVITIGGQREVLGAAGGAAPAGGVASGSPPADDSTATGVATRSRAEVEKLVEEQGSTPPDWLESTPLNYPRTLDLSWPDRPPPPWNNQRNVGQYVWDIINPNPAKYREGVRLMHHLLAMHKDDPNKRVRAMTNLARMYQDLIGDYARAAFWWKKAGADQGDYSGVNLAECYWNLGSKELALEVLRKSPASFPMIKLFGEMGELSAALRLADANLKSSVAEIACLYAGDACRVAGKYDQALQYYQKVLQIPATGQHGKRIARGQARARANIEAIQLFDTLDLARVPDGTYRSSSLGYEEDVHVEVVVRGKRIESVRVTAHHEKQYYNAMTETPAKIIAKQSVKGVDTTSRATITSEAIVNATAKALSKAMQ
ncbi:MAG: FMN-binding protein [Planctomycetota bacterium]